MGIKTSVEYKDGWPAKKPIDKIFKVGFAMTAWFILNSEDFEGIVDQELARAKKRIMKTREDLIEELKKEA